MNIYIHDKIEVPYPFEAFDLKWIKKNIQSHGEKLTGKQQRETPTTDRSGSPEVSIAGSPVGAPSN